MAAREGSSHAREPPPPPAESLTPTPPLLPSSKPVAIITCRVGRGGGLGGGGGAGGAGGDGGGGGQAPQATHMHDAHALEAGSAVQWRVHAADCDAALAAGRLHTPRDSARSKWAAPQAHASDSDAAASPLCRCFVAPKVSHPVRGGPEMAGRGGCASGATKSVRGCPLTASGAPSAHAAVPSPNDLDAAAASLHERVAAAMPASASV